MTVNMGNKEEITLFGSEKGWRSSDWTASDDRVRGGKSQSYLEISGSSARFHGTLDIKTLGGAGFASQRTITESETWDLSDYDGIRLDIGKSDGKKYTIIVKDELLPRNPENGREQATISYEYDFAVDESAVIESTSIFVPWKDLVPKYRGKEKNDAPKFDTKNGKRFSIMMRSFFGDQKGDFSLTIESIKAVSLSTHLEKGSVGEVGKSLPKPTLRNFNRRSSAAATLGVILSFGIVYAAYLAFYPLFRDSYHMRAWRQ
ncbi:CIA30-domain-containing protein [Lojkania enalia]|uniref:CIA30-domain-containing protein n=1 Tax=Lojkania enalia TaxID=147567 RepID=A0A9P4KIH4_9PLEO|nr:CIA30-domain-containing protein [Didymosphaeria enalia]